MNSRGLLPRLDWSLLLLMNILACNNKTKGDECFTAGHMESLVYQLQKDRGQNAHYMEIGVRYPGNGHYEIDIWATSNTDSSSLYHRIFNYHKHGHTWFGTDQIPYPGYHATFTLEDLKMMKEVSTMAMRCREKVKKMIGSTHSNVPIPTSLHIFVDNPISPDHIRYLFTFTNILSGEEYQFEFNTEFKLISEDEAIPMFQPGSLN